MFDQPVGEPEPRDFSRDRLTLLTYGMIVAFGFAVAAMGPAMPLFRQDLEISRTVGGLHFTAMASGSVLTGLVIGRAVGARGRRRVFWLGGAGVATGCVLLAAGWHPAITLSGCFVIGAFGSAVLIVSQAALSDRHQSHRPVALTEANTAMSIGTVAPALLIGALTAIGAGWRPALVVPVAIWLALVLVMRSEVFPSPVTADEPGHRWALPGSYWLFWAAFIPAVGAEWSVGAWGADYLVDVAGTTEGAASLLMSAFFGAMVLGRLVGGRVARWANEEDDSDFVVVAEVIVALVDDDQGDLRLPRGRLDDFECIRDQLLRGCRIDHVHHGSGGCVADDRRDLPGSALNWKLGGVAQSWAPVQGAWGEAARATRP